MIVGGLIGLLVVLLLLLPLWIGPVATGIANGVVPGITGTEFKMERFALNPYTGKIFIGGVNLANPKGYDEKTAFSVTSIAVDLDFASLLGKTIHVRDITIESPFVSYVFDDAGSNNFERILANVNKDAKEEEKKEETKEGGKKVRIDRLCVNGTKVKYRMITLPIPVPTLTNLGAKDDEGITVEEVKDTVWKSIENSFTSIGGSITGAASALTGALTNATGDLLKKVPGVDAAKAATDTAKKATEAVGDTAKKATESVGDATKAATDSAKKATEAVGDTAKKATEAVGDAAKKFGNLFK